MPEAPPVMSARRPARGAGAAMPVRVGPGGDRPHSCRPHSSGETRGTGPHQVREVRRSAPEGARQAGIGVRHGCRPHELRHVLPVTPHGRTATCGLPSSGTSTAQIHNSEPDTAPRRGESFMSAPAHAPTRFGRVVGASVVGTTVEWYDFFLYGSAAALVFPQLFFPEQDEFAGTLSSFATYAVGFFARPVGALVFGHFGDRIGRKKLLVISLLMMGGATFAIGLLPTYATVGVLAPVLLIVLRLIQGFALGGEWGGAVLLVSEHGRPENRGFWASWPQSGAPAGNLLATGVLALLAAFQSDDAFAAWGWRIPFLLSAVLIIVGMWVRLTAAESPVFLEAQRAAEAKAAKTGAREQAPVLTVLARYKREVLTAMGARIAENVSFYLLTSFSLTYLTKALGLSSSFALNAVLIASAVHLVTIPLWGRCPTASAAARSTCSVPPASGCGRSSSSGWPTPGASAWPSWRSPAGCSSTAPCTDRRRPSSPSCSARRPATPAWPSGRNWRRAWRGGAPPPPPPPPPAGSPPPPPPPGGP